MRSFQQTHGRTVLEALVSAVQENKQYLSDIDGQIGDGDHGINMSKGFTLFARDLPEGEIALAEGLKSLSRVLMTQIGGSMGPLYGMFFRSMAKAAEGNDEMDAAVFGAMLTAAREGIQGVSQAKPGDKTIMDALVPADEAYRAALADGRDLPGCLEAMAEAARAGRDSTKDLVAKLGRSSRLGERSKGVIDAGAASCALILETFARTLTGLSK